MLLKPMFPSPRLLKPMFQLPVLPKPMLLTPLFPLPRLNVPFCQSMVSAGSPVAAYAADAAARSPCSLGSIPWKGTSLAAAADASA